MMEMCNDLMMMHIVRVSASIAAVGLAIEHGVNASIDLSQTPEHTK